MASQGPANLKIKNKGKGWDPQYKWEGSANWINGTNYAQQADINWLGYVKRKYGAVSLNSVLRAYAIDVVGYYANKFANIIDGYWFDHARDDTSARYINTLLVKQVLNKYDPTGVVAFNAGAGTNVPLTVQSPFYEDFTAGHPNKIKVYPPYDVINEPMITAIEETHGTGLIAGRSVGHCFFTTLESTWNAVGYSPDLQPAWDRRQAIDWMNRTVMHNGAWTWNVPRQEYRTGEYSKLQYGAVDFLKQVSNCVYNPDAPKNCYEKWAQPTPAPTPIPLCELPNPDDTAWVYNAGGAIKSKPCSAPNYWSGRRCNMCAKDAKRNLFYRGLSVNGQWVSVRKACPRMCRLTCAEWRDEPNIPSC